MAQGSSYDPYGGYGYVDRRTAQQIERERKAWERQQAQEASVARDDQAVALTSDVEWQVAELENLLRSSLGRDSRIDLSLRRRHAVVPPIDLGADAFPSAPPVYSAPAEPTGMGRVFGGKKRYEEAQRLAEQRYALEQEDYERAEYLRQQRVAQKTQAHQYAVEQAEHDAAEENRRFDALAVGLRDADRHCVSEYMDMVLVESPYPHNFPIERRAGYVPESALLAVEWYLPPIEVVPAHKAYRHIKTRRTIEPTDRPLKDIRRLYQRIIAQIALRAVREVFGASSEELISTVVFNGMVRAVDPATGQQTEPPLISMRATREQFARLVLDEPKFDPVACVRKHFFADVSPHPDELIPVEPVMSFKMADPRIIDPVDIISDIDKRPNLLDLTPGEFEAFIQNLFTRMRFDTKLFQASGDRGVDCVAYDPHPITGGKFIVQAKLYTGTVKPTHVRDLWGTVQHEGATKGIMITTSGYGPESYKFANGKPLNLIDGSGLLALCQQHEIPARIVNRSKTARRDESA